MHIVLHVLLQKNIKILIPIKLPTLMRLDWLVWSLDSGFNVLLMHVRSTPRNNTVTVKLQCVVIGIFISHSIKTKSFYCQFKSLNFVCHLNMFLRLFLQLSLAFELFYQWITLVHSIVELEHDRNVLSCMCVLLTYVLFPTFAMYMKCLVIN